MSLVFPVQCYVMALWASATPEALVIDSHGMTGVCLALRVTCVNTACTNLGEEAHIFDRARRRQEA